MTSVGARAEAQAIELLIQQQQQRERAATTATVLDHLAQICADAHAVVQGLDVADVTARLTRSVTAMQANLRLVGQNVGAILQDEEQMRELCDYMKHANYRALEGLHLSSPALLDNQEQCQSDGPILADSSALVGSHSKCEEENVRNVMVVAENMCAMMDHALSTITNDELALASQLSLDIAQKLLEAGQSLFTSLGDDERRKARVGDRGDRITIEEVEDDQEEVCGTLDALGTVQGGKQQREMTGSRQLRHEAVLRTYVTDLYNRTQKVAVKHPFLAGAVTATGLPFIGLTIPVASLVAVALVVEKYYPKHTELTLELCSNFVQMSKLWWLLLKIGARQVSVVATECFKSWYEYASKNGFMATGMEMASTGCNLGFVGASYLYRMTVCFTKQVLQ